MTAHAEVSPVGLSLAATNLAILQALEAAPAKSPGEVAKRCGLDTKNIGRAFSNLEREGLIAAGDHLWTVTDVGRRARIAAEVARGATPPSADAGGLRLRHDQLRPNPLNPGRKRITPESVAAMAASIEADLEQGGEGLLQNLVVFPADEEGVHTLAAGETRWQAIGLLIEQGKWPADRPLPCVERENSAGRTSFIALVENGQRQDLPLIEEARAYHALVEETGWSARHAAIQTGRDPKTVQEMLKVIREAREEDIDAHEKDPKTHTWEWLRNSVKKPQERDADQVDLEDVLGKVRDVVEAGQGGHSGPAPMIGGGATMATPPKPPRQPAGPDAELSPLQGLAMLELAHKLANSELDAGEWTTVRRYWLDATASDLQGLLFVVFSHTVNANGPHAGMTAAGRAWVAAHGGVPINKGALTLLRQKAGATREGDGYATPWLNVDAPMPAPQTEAEPTAPPAAASDPAPHDEATEADWELLERVRDTVSGGTWPDAQDAFQLMQELRLDGPFTVSMESGLVVDAQGRTVCVVDADRERPDPQAEAIARLVAAGLNRLADTYPQAAR